MTRARNISNPQAVTLPLTVSANITSNASLAVGNTSITGTLTASANVNLDSGTFFVDGTNNRVGIGTTTPNWQFHIKGPYPYIAFEDTEASIANTISTITGYQSGALYYDSDTNGVQSSSNAAHYFRTGGTTIASILGTGVLDLPYGRIKFPATQNASSDANTLDDYEEGTWTLTIQGGTTTGTFTTVVREGYYTKIGRQVSIIGRIAASSFTGTGDFIISGLPFPAAYECSFAVQFNQNPWSNLLTGSSQILGIAGNLAPTYIIFRACDNDTTNGAFTQLTCGSTAVEYLRFSFTYFI